MNGTKRTVSQIIFSLSLFSLILPLNIKERFLIISALPNLSWDRAFGVSSVYAAVGMPTDILTVLKSILHIGNCFN